MKHTPVTRTLLHLESMGHDSLLVRLSVQQVPSEIDGSIEANNEPGYMFFVALQRLNIKKSMNKIVVSGITSLVGSLSGTTT